MALISANKANIPLDFKMAAAIDLAGRDVFEAVQSIETGGTVPPIPPGVISSVRIGA